jgi:hypothetical protein
MEDSQIKLCTLLYCLENNTKTGELRNVCECNTYVTCYTVFVATSKVFFISHHYDLT